MSYASVASLHEPYLRHTHPHSVIARTWSVGNFGFGDSPESPLDRHSRHRTLTPHGRCKPCGANKMRQREISSRNGTPHTVRAFRAKAGKCHLEPSAPRQDRKRWQGTAGISFLNREAIGRRGSICCGATWLSCFLFVRYIHNNCPLDFQSCLIRWGD